MSHPFAEELSDGGERENIDVIIGEQQANDLLRKHFRNYGVDNNLVT